LTAETRKNNVLLIEELWLWRTGTQFFRPILAEVGPRRVPAAALEMAPPWKSGA